MESSPKNSGVYPTSEELATVSDIACSAFKPRHIAALDSMRGLKDRPEAFVVAANAPDRFAIVATGVCQNIAETRQMLGAAIVEHVPLGETLFPDRTWREGIVLRILEMTTHAELPRAYKVIDSMVSMLKLIADRQGYHGIDMKVIEEEVEMITALEKAHFQMVHEIGRRRNFLKKVFCWQPTPESFFTGVQ